MEGGADGGWGWWRVGLVEGGTGGGWDWWRVGLVEGGAGGGWGWWRVGLVEGGAGGGWDPEGLFSMVSKIETDQRSSLLPSTVADLISVKVNTSSECYERESLITPSLLSSAKQATTTSLSSSSTDTV